MSNKGLLKHFMRRKKFLLFQILNSETRYLVVSAVTSVHFLRFPGKIPLGMAVKLINEGPMLKLFLVTLLTSS